MKSGTSKMFLTMLVGFGLLCYANVVCFFPHALMPDAPEWAYRTFNAGAAWASLVTSIIYGASILRLRSRFIPLSALTGYALALIGILLSTTVGYNESDASLLAAGMSCGTGLSLAMFFWFGLLTCLTEHRAALTQGWQALIGELAFIILWFILSDRMAITATGSLVVSGTLGVFAWRLATKDLADNESYLGDVFKPHPWLTDNRVTLPQSLAFPFAGLVLVSLAYGVVEAMAMTQDGPAFGFYASAIGAPIGAVIFLFWQQFGRKRSYDLAVKVVFAVLAVALLILPFVGVTLILSLSFQLSGLLLYSLVIDELGSSRRRAITVIAWSFGASRILFLFGLHLPSAFGVESYHMLLHSTSLILILTYAMFGTFYLIDSRQRSSQLRTAKERLRMKEEQERRQAQSAVKVSEEGYMQACRMLGCTCNLTKRETEVLELLARGRNTAYVCETLFLTRNTVKGYVKSIYVKAGVHSRQELIDRIEDACHDVKQGRQDG